MIRKRDNSIDAISGFCIVVMLIGHFAFGGGYTELVFIATAYMPWFFYKAGIYLQKKNFIDVFYKEIRKYLRSFIPYAFYSWIIFSILKYIEGDRNLVHYFLTPIKEYVLVGAIEANLPLWFLTTFLLTKLLFSLLPSKRMYEYLACIGSMSIACFLFYLNNPIFPHFTATFSGFTFLLMGHILKDYRKNMFLFVFFLIIFVISLIIGNTAVNMKDNCLERGFYPLWYIYSLASCYIFDRIINKLNGWYSFPILSWIGKNSLIIFGTHWIYLYIIKYTYNCSFINNYDIYYRIFVTLSIIVLEYITVKICNVIKIKNN